MTKAQNKLYWREWGLVAKRFKNAGYSAADIDEERWFLMAQACGKTVSSKKLTDTQLDMVLQHFRAASGTASVDDMMADGSKTRLLHGIGRLAEDWWIMGIVKDVWPGVTDWRTLDVEDLLKLRRRISREQRKGGAQ